MINYIRNIFKRNGTDTFGSLVSPTPTYSKYGTEKQKLQMVLSNPAVLKVFMLQCDLFSLGKFNEEEIDRSVLNLLKNPNPFQSKRQILWDYMFWLMLGNAVIYIKSNNADRSNNMIYFLDVSRLEFDDKLTKKLNRLILSNSSLKEIQESQVEYINENGKSNFFKIKDLIFISDMTNGVGNWLKGNSRIDALYKIISNSESGIDSKNINARFLGKYIATGTIGEENISLPMMSNTEKTDIEKKLNGNKSVHAVKSPIDIKRFIEKSAVLKSLDESYLADYYKIGKLYGIPRDVLEAYQSSTYENQEKARGSHVSYTLQPKADDLCERLTNFFNIKEPLQMSWEHLPFMQVFEKERAEVKQTNIATLKTMLENGYTREEAENYLNINIEK